jgi:glycosyltransferase involved in cell wall biosynthesis
LSAVKRDGESAVSRGDSRRLKLGIIANELFSTDVGRMGGFGWAVQQVSRCFAEDPALGIDVVILMGEKRPANAALPHELHGSRVIWRAPSAWQRIRELRSERFDLLLCIDYRPNYRFFFNAMPRVPVVIWARDPWDSRDRNEVATLRIPGKPSEQPRGTQGMDTRSLSQVARLSRLVRRPLLIATTARFIAEKIADAYGFDPGPAHLLPNIINPVSGQVKKAERPTVVSLARLDPTKRPWVFAALAERLPDIDFIFMGQSHMRGRGSWKAQKLPPNARLLGHVGEVEKRRLLSEAWLLVSTSIHEGLSVSFLEALACDTPLVACVDPEELVSRFGVFVGTCSGTGMDAVPVLASAVRDLLMDDERRQRLGSEGRAWVSATHNRVKFLEAFVQLCALARVRAPTIDRC